MIPFQDNNPTQRTPFFTYGLIAANVLIFLWGLSLPEDRLRQLHLQRGFVPARIQQLGDPRPMEVVYDEPARDHWGQLVMVERTVRFDGSRGEVFSSLLTCMFLHGGWMHLLGNMWFLWIFGDNVEDRLGGVPYLLLYLVGGLAASAAHWATGPNSTVPVIGASGAVAAILGAYAITWPWARVHTLVFLFIFVTIIDLPALLVLGFWFVGQILSGMRVGAGEAASVAFWAHVGGFLAGSALMPMFSSVLGVGEPRQWERD